MGAGVGRGRFFSRVRLQRPHDQIADQIANEPAKALMLVETLLRYDTVLGQDHATAPESPPTRLARLAVSRRRRRCGRSMA
jgi:hypothetical protein